MLSYAFQLRHHSEELPRWLMVWLTFIGESSRCASMRISASTPSSRAPAEREAHLLQS
jgi:hypothetical protein